MTRTRTLTTTYAVLSAAALLLGLGGVSAQADVIRIADLGDGGRNLSDWTVTVTELLTGPSVTASGPDRNTPGINEGSFDAALVNDDDEYEWVGRGWTSASWDGSNLSLDGEGDVIRFGGTGMIGPGSQGAIRGDNEALTFDWDLSGLPSGVSLELTELELGNVSGAGDAVLVIDRAAGGTPEEETFALDGSDDTFSNLSIDISDGDRFAFFRESGSDLQYGAFGFSVQAVPEPATMGLIVLGGVGLLLKRRRRA